MTDIWRHVLRGGGRACIMSGGGGDTTRRAGVPIMLEELLEQIRVYCGTLGERPVQVQILLASGSRIEHPFPRCGREAGRKAGEGYRSVLWDGACYTFTATQARAVEALWNAAEEGTPEMHQSDVLDAANSDQLSLSMVFRGHPAWNVMIVRGTGKGMFRLAGEGGCEGN